MTKGMRTKELSEDKIRDLIKWRAQELCKRRGCAPGNEWADWFEAEKQIKRELQLTR